MTQEADTSVIGGVVVEYSEIKKRLAALEAEVRKVSQLFQKFEVALRNPLDLPPGIEADLERLITPDKLRATVKEIRDKQARKIELEKTIKDFGLANLIASQPPKSPTSDP